MKIIVINGPNLNLLGKREPEKYGNRNFESYLEGELINKLHEVGFSYDGIILNAGAYTHTSIALADAVAAITTPVIEVHISNVHAREAFRHKSYLSAVSKGLIVGFGLESYALALHNFNDIQSL